MWLSMLPICTAGCECYLGSNFGVDAIQMARGGCRRIKSGGNDAPLRRIRASDPGVAADHCGGRLKSPDRCSHVNSTTSIVYPVINPVAEPHSALTTRLLHSSNHPRSNTRGVKEKRGNSCPLISDCLMELLPSSCRPLFNCANETSHSSAFLARDWHSHRLLSCRPPDHRWS